VSDSPQYTPIPPQPQGAPVQSGLSDNAAGALAYVTFIPAIVFLAAEPYNKSPFIRFHAWQSIFLCVALVALWVLDVVLAFIPIIGWLIALLLGIGLVVLWIVCFVKALGGQKFVVPIIGPFAEKQAHV
jgi:uncharacterized membrane protein